MNKTKIEAPWNDGHEAGRRLAWTPAEYAQNDQTILVAEAEGFALEITKESASKWNWIVNFTAAISETPEVLATGTAGSESGAKAACGHSIAKELRAKLADEQKAEKAKAKPKTKPRAKTAAKAA